MVPPGPFGRDQAGPAVVGTFGEFHPRTLEGLDVSGPLCGFEVYMSTPSLEPGLPTKTKPKPCRRRSRRSSATSPRRRQGGRGRHADPKALSPTRSWSLAFPSSTSSRRRITRRGQEVGRHRGHHPAGFEKTLTDQDFEAHKIVENVKKQDRRLAPELITLGEEHGASSLQGPAV